MRTRYEANRAAMTSKSTRSSSDWRGSDQYAMGSDRQTGHPTRETDDSTELRSKGWCSALEDVAKFGG